MLIGIFSDIHSNYEALSQVLEFYEANPCDHYVCLGDVVGYGADPEICCKLVREKVKYAVVGNHDAAVSGRMKYDYYYDAARNALDWHSELLSDENLKWLKDLPYLEHLDEMGVAFCHGSPINSSEFEYVFSIEQANQLCAHHDKLAWVTFIGHSHLTKSFSLSPQGAVDITGPRLELDPNLKYIVTVGSVHVNGNCRIEGFIYCHNMNFDAGFIGNGTADILGGVVADVIDVNGTLLVEYREPTVELPGDPAAPPQFASISWRRVR